MELAPAGVVLAFEVTFDSPYLDVGMSVYLDGPSPTLAQGPTPMNHVVANTYRGQFLGTAGSCYIIIKAVYTDSSLTVMSPDYAQGSESIVVQNIGGSSNPPPPGSIIGFVISNPAVIGFVNC